MNNDQSPASESPPSLLTSSEPEPFRVLNGRSTLPLLLLCDHASRRIPASLGDLGLDPAALRCHLAWDIGAGALTQMLAERLGATAVLCNYSRLVVDCNRELLDPQAFLEYGDGVVISGNRGLDDAQREARVSAIFRPYHAEISNQIYRLREHGSAPPAILAIHSFTPVLNGVSRSWQIGILWDKDARVADMLIRGLREDGFNVGDNEPYSGRAPQDFTIDHHAESAGLPHVGIEVRQDLIDDDAGVREIADAFEPLFHALPERLRDLEQPAASG